jgi:hypothetical protein
MLYLMFNHPFKKLLIFLIGFGKQTLFLCESKNIVLYDWQIAIHALPQ